MRQSVLARPDVTAADAVRIACECYGIEATAKELGSTQDRNFLLIEADGGRSVLRVDNPVFDDRVRDSQHAAIDAYRAAGIATAQMMPGLDGEITQRWGSFAARRSEFVSGDSLIDYGYLAPIVLEEFGELAAASVRALECLDHPALDRAHMWDMRAAYDETMRLAPAIIGEGLRARVLTAAEAAHAVLAPLAESLPVQAIHGDLTDDNVMGVLGNDARVHPKTVLDFGDLSYGWRVAELAVTVTSMLNHEPERPLRILESIAAFHRRIPLTRQEAQAVWPLVVLRSALLVASGWGQLAIDSENDYLRERLEGKRVIFDIVTAVDLAEGAEQVLARLGFIADAPAMTGTGGAPLSRLLPEFTGEVRVLDLGIESSEIDSGRWMAGEAEGEFVATSLQTNANATLLPYGVFRLTRTAVDCSEAAPTWPLDTEVWMAPGATLRVHTPLSGTVLSADGSVLVVEVEGGWRLRISGVLPEVSAGAYVDADAAIGTLVASESMRSLAVGLRRADAPETGAGRLIGRAVLVAPERVPAWSRLSRDPAPLLGLETLQQRDEAAEEVSRRDRIFARAQQRYYEHPMQIERGWRQYLVDTTGRSYIDMVNNVSGLGHGHPGVADAASRQLRILNTNSRFLYRELAEYSERLLALLPANSDLDTVLLVNSGSEAVDLALRLVQAATGQKTIISLREAYHGWTMGATAVTTNAKDNRYALENRPEWIHVADIPNSYRGTHRGEGAGGKYAADLGAELDVLAAEERGVAGFICESVLGNAGGLQMPEGYLAEVYARVRAVGGLCIADEVQVGFGRLGSSFWGFEQSGVTPDLITIAKSMGNGYPIGGVITSKRIADSLATQGQFFSSAGGNPLSCRVGLAVLDAMEAESLQANARVIGGRLADGLRALAQRHQIIGAVHGEGLYLGVELVRDRETLEPATAEAKAICERLKDLGVIMLPTSERSNVLKVKPPLCLTADSADFVVAVLDRVLTEGW